MNTSTASSTLADCRGDTLSGATPAALPHYERAAAAFLHWREGGETEAGAALALAPDFTMAHVLLAWKRVSGRDPAQVRAARPHLARAASLPANPREQLHIAALQAIVGDDFVRTQARLAELLRIAPHDALALQMAHSFDHLLGDEAALLGRVEAVLPAWSQELPGYSAVLAMHAFALGENGLHARAERVALEALAFDPLEARAHHAMAHVFEMTLRPQAGIRWMHEHAAAWASGSAVSRHAWWHVALYELACDNIDGAIVIYDEHIRAGQPGAVGDLIDAASLLWRLRLKGATTGHRFAELAGAWEPHAADAYCSFSDIHAMLAFVGAGRHRLARALETRLRQQAARPQQRHGATTRSVGLPVIRALAAHGRGDHALVAQLLAGLPPLAHRIGGSQAQRQLLQLTHQHALLHGSVQQPASARVWQRGAGATSPACRAASHPAGPRSQRSISN
ncbi:MAG: tetratricopeptide repeat protein [Piscinibacter sp.]